jgi:hypothetical protein
MTSFDFSGLLSTIGGAVSAQAAGGGRGMQQFLDGLNKREEARLNRNHDAAQQSRQRMFQMTRDRMQLQAAQEERKAAQDFTLGRDEAQREYNDNVRADEQAFAKSQAESSQAFTERRDEANRAHSIVMATKQQIFDLEKLEQNAENQEKLAELRARLNAEEAVKDRAFRALAQDKDITAREKSQRVSQQFTATQAALNRAADAMARQRQSADRREDQERQNEFTANQNALERKNRLDVQNARYDREDRREKEAEEKKLNRSATAQWGMLSQGTEAQRRAAEDGLRALLGPEMGVPDGQGGIIYQEIDWNDPETGIPLLARGIEKGGFSAQAAFKSAEERTAAEADLVRMTGQPDTYTNDADYLETKRQYTAAERGLTKINQRAADIARDITNYSNSQLPLDQSITREEEIGRAAGQLATEFGEFKRGANQFTGTGAGLEGMTNAVQSALTGLGAQIEQAQEKRAINATGAYSTTEPLRFVGFMPRYEDMFSVLNNSESMQTKAKEWDTKAVALADMTDEQAGYANLSNDEIELRNRLRQHRNEKDGLNLLAINRDIQAAYQGDNEKEAERLGSLIEGIGNLDLNSKMVAAQRNAAQARGIEALRSFALQRHRTSGLTMFSNDEEAAAALQEFGPKNEDGTPRAPQSQEEFLKFQQDYYSAPQGVEKMAQDIMGSLQLVSGLDLGEQVDAKLKATLRDVGLSGNREVRSKLRNTLRQRVGDLGDNAITNNSEAIGEIHRYDYEKTDLMRSTALNSGVDFLKGEELQRYQENYPTSVLGEVIDVQDRAGVIGQFISETRTAYPGYRQTAPGFWSGPLTGGGANLLTNYGEQIRLKLKPEEADPLTDSASFADLHQLFMRVDPQYAQAMADPGLLYSRRDLSPSRRLAANLSESLRASYTKSAGYKKADQYTVNVFDKLDYMRSVNVAAMEGATAAERDMLGGIQTYLKKLTVPQALAAIASPGNRQTPAGFRFADMGVELPDPTVQEDAARMQLPVDPLFSIDIQAHLRDVDEAIVDTENFAVSPLTMVDLNPRQGEDYGVITEKNIEAELANLAEAKVQLKALDAARSSEVRQNVRGRMSQYVGKGDFQSMKTMATRLGDQLPLILGESQDMVALEATPARNLVEKMANAETNAAGLEAMVDLLAVSTASSVEAQMGMSMVSATDKSMREAVLKVIRLDFGTMKEQIHMLNAHLGQIAETREGLKYERLPDRLRAQIDKGEFDMLVTGKEKDYDQRLMLAFRLWTADQNAR